MRSAVVFAGVRPNFMTVAPVLLRAPDHHLEVGSGTHAVQAARMMSAFEPVPRLVPWPLTVDGILAT